MSRDARFSIFGQILLTLFLVAFLIVLLSCKPSAAPFSSPASTPTLSSTEIAIRQMLATKAALVKQANETAMAPRLTPHPPSTELPKPTPVGVGSEAPEPTALIPIPGTPAGAGRIIPAMVGSFSPMNYRIESTWYEDTNGGRTRTYVHTGAIAEPGGGVSQQGVVIIQIFQISPENTYKTFDLIYSRAYSTQLQSGSIHVTGAVGERLILQSTNGIAFYFDVPSR